MAKTDNSTPVYTCACGFTESDKVKFTTHLLGEGRKQPGVHKSLGLLDPKTGATVLPPEKERTREQKNAVSAVSFEKRKAREAGSPKKPGDSTGSSSSTAKMVRTEAILEATTLRFTPRVYEAPLSPIMVGAREAATNVWGWPPEMNFGDFIDTWLYFSFKAFGITLSTYTIDETVIEQPDVPADGESDGEEEEIDNSEDSEEETEEDDAGK